MNRASGDDGNIEVAPGIQSIGKETIRKDARARFLRERVRASLNGSGAGYV